MSNKKEAVIELLKKLKETQIVDIENQIIEICGPVIDEMYSIFSSYAETYEITLPEFFDDMYDAVHSKLFEISEFDIKKEVITFEGVVINVYSTTVTMPLWWLEENANVRFNAVCKEAAKEQLEKRLNEAQESLDTVKGLLAKLKEEN